MRNDRCKLIIFSDQISDQFSDHFVDKISSREMMNYLKRNYKEMVEKVRQVTGSPAGR